MVYEAAFSKRLQFSILIMLDVMLQGLFTALERDRESLLGVPWFGYFEETETLLFVY